MESPKPNRTTEPGTLLSQWWTLGAILADTRTAGRHSKVAWIILDRHMRKSGNARASIRYIEQASGLSQHTVIKACRELVEWGYFEQHLGSGTRPTEYTPNWLVLHPSTALASAEPLYSTSAEPMCSTSGSSAEPMCSESYVLIPADKAGLSVCKEVSAAPDADGLSATAPASGFEDVWKAYGKLGNKARARKAFEAIDLDTFDLDTIMERARSWAASAKPGQRRMPLEKWLEAEKFDEADRAVEPRPKKAASAEIPKIPTPANDNVPAPRLVTITSSRLEEAERSRAAIFNAVAEDGETIEIYISYEHEWQWAQEAGQQNLTELARAVGIEAFEDTEDLHNIPFLLGQNEAGGHTYLPAPSRAKETQHA